MISGSSSPIRTNTNPFRTNPIIFQLVSQRTRLFGRQDRPQPAADHEAGSDRGEHSREPELVGWKVGGERDDERDHDLDRRVVEPPKDLARDPTDQDADRDPADRRGDEARQSIGEDEGAADGRHHRRPIGNERGRIVEQGLALDEGHDDARRAEPTEDGGRGQRVRRRDDRPEGEGGGPAQVRDRRRSPRPRRWPS